MRDVGCDPREVPRPTRSIKAPRGPPGSDAVRGPAACGTNPTAHRVARSPSGIAANWLQQLSREAGQDASLQRVLISPDGGLRPSDSTVSRCTSGARLVALQSNVERGALPPGGTGPVRPSSDGGAQPASNRQTPAWLARLRELYQHPYRKLMCSHDTQRQRVAHARTVAGRRICLQTGQIVRLRS